MLFFFIKNRLLSDISHFQGQGYRYGAIIFELVPFFVTLWYAYKMMDHKFEDIFTKKVPKKILWAKKPIWWKGLRMTDSLERKLQLWTFLTRLIRFDFNLSEIFLYFFKSIIKVQKAKLIWRNFHFFLFVENHLQHTTLWKNEKFTLTGKKISSNQLK